MSQKPLKMEQIKQVKRLHDAGTSISKIARLTGHSRNTVKKYLRRIGDQNTDTSEIGNDNDFASLAYNNDFNPNPDQRLTALLQHFKDSVSDLPKTGVTRKLLWMEYKDVHPAGYEYSQYCSHLKSYLNNTNPSFHIDHNPGEFIQCDFAGKKLFYLDKDNNKIYCEVFVAVLPFSGLAFCMAVFTQRIPDFVICMITMLKYFGGVPLSILVDNLRTAVKRASIMEPIFTETCYQLAEHYQTTFSAARPGEPRDKGMAERHVEIIYQNIYAPIRNKTFSSIEDLNKGIMEGLEKLNNKRYKGSSKSRMDIFLAHEASALKPLPSNSFELMNVKRVKVQRNYYIQLQDNKHYYSVPYTYVGKEVKVYYNRLIVEVYHRNDRIALHKRSSTESKYNRIKEHMPPNHRAMVEAGGWTEEELVDRASSVGIYTAQAAKNIIHSSIYPEQNFKACNAMILLQNTYGKKRLEAACKRASIASRTTLTLIRNILKNNQDQDRTLFDAPQDDNLPDHDNIRGPGYYT